MSGILTDPLKELQKTPTASISDALDRVGVKGFMSHKIKPAFEFQRVVGPAVTVKQIPTHEREIPLRALEAIDSAEPGAVMVIAVEGGDADDIALWGGLMSLASKVRGVCAAVLDGGVRDLVEIREIGFPVFSRSIVPSTSVGRMRVVGVNVPVSCGNVLVKPGDIIIGDWDGVVVIPLEKLNEVMEIARQIDETERKEAEELRRGTPFTTVIKKFARV